MADEGAPYERGSDNKIGIRNTDPYLRAGEIPSLDKQDASNLVGYEIVTPSTTVDVIPGTTGAPGDVLSGVYINTTLTEALIIKDGATEVYTIPNGTVGLWQPDKNDVMAAEGWSLKATTAYTSAVVFNGRYT